MGDQPDSQLICILYILRQITQHVFPLHICFGKKQKTSVCTLGSAHSVVKPVFASLYNVLYKVRVDPWNYTSYPFSLHYFFPRLKKIRQQKENVPYIRD